MKKLLVVLSLAMAAFSFQASAATLNWVSTPVGATAIQVNPGSLYGARNPAGNPVLPGSLVDDNWTFMLSAFSQVQVGVSSLPGLASWLTAELLDSTNALVASIGVNGAIWRDVLGAGEYTLHLFGTAPLGQPSYALSVETPIPAAVWLFGSALMGLTGLSRRKKA